jgi:nucleoid DNA-binding protein
MKWPMRLQRVIGFKFGDYVLYYVKKFKSYTGRNPKTGEPTRVNGKKLPFFKCSKELKERVDY